ncbi:MAG: beta-hydroxyacyl-ACP dehydratase [Thermoguttaceae bacterium]|nr:beta-hydroxyacyl-ACP dehydratase [Thermoguttaceae bacterium]MDW8077835.1 beta-hydroxyacyl-ACP dehydratase [Thermoguttaceae bacterium]
MRWCWIDRFIEFEAGRSAKAVKVISLAEDYVHDYLPGYPLVPRCFVIEGLAQTAGLLVSQQFDFRLNVILAKIPRIVFFHEAFPGDVLTYVARAEFIRRDGALTSTQCLRGEELLAEGQIFFAIFEAGQQMPLFRRADFLHQLRMLRLFEVGRGPDGTPLPLPAELTEPV